MIKTLITGTAGFIGYHLTEKLLAQGYQVVGLDNINDYYSVDLKYRRLQNHGIERDKIKEHMLLSSEKNPNYSFVKADLADHDF